MNIERREDGRLLTEPHPRHDTTGPLCDYHRARSRQVRATRVMLAINSTLVVCGGAALAGVTSAALVRGGVVPSTASVLVHGFGWLTLSGALTAWYERGGRRHIPPPPLSLVPCYPTPGGPSLSAWRYETPGWGGLLPLALMGASAAWGVYKIWQHMYQAGCRAWVVDEARV